VGELGTFIDAVGYISSEIRYFSSPVASIMSGLDSIADYGRLRIFGICAEKLKSGEDIPSAWKSAANEAAGLLSLDSADMDILLRFGEALGRTDAEGQQANCSRCRESLKARLKDADDERVRRGRLYSSLGVLAGAFAVVMLI
jgi:stage III sporulation protein AB